MDIVKVQASWDNLERYLITTRYAVRSVEDGTPIEATWQDLVQRFENYFKSEKVQRAVKECFPGGEKGDKLVQDLILAIRNRLIIPATPFLMSFGNPYTRRKGYFSCYPLGYVPDSMEGIYEICRQMMEIYIRGGGCGVDISKLRPKNSPVDQAQGVASGPVGFLTLFDAVTGTTNQGGRRRGALLVQMHWKHPDIKRFIKAKSLVPAISSVVMSAPEDEKVDVPLSNMNISVVVDEEFFNPQNEELFSLIAHQAWKTGDPGLLFLHNMVEYTPFNPEHDERDFPGFSNPCAEYLAPAYTACNLITVNVAKLASLSLKDGSFDFQKFYRAVFETAYLACFLGTVLVHLDEGYPLEQIKEATQRVRPVGVGMTGFHTALLLAYNGDVKYGYDEESLRFAERTQASLTLGTLKLSSELVEATQVFYPWKKSYLELHLSELKEIIDKDKLPFKNDFKLIESVAKKYGGFYHSVTTSQPPTGSVSLFARVAGDTGIEPMFAIELKRRIRDFESGSWREVEILTEYLMPKILDKDFRKKVEAQLAHEVKPINQLAILASFQKFIHTGISKTINCPYDTSVEEIKDLIKRSADFRLKGFTIFREGCREDTVLVKAKPCSSPQSKTSQRDKSEELSPVRFALVYEVRGTVNAYITTTFDEEKKLREVFINVGKAGTTLNSMFQAVGRIISVGLRRHPDLAERFIQTLKGIESGEFYSCNDLHSKSLPDMIAKIMEDAINKVRGSAPTLEALAHGSQIGVKGRIAENTEEVRIAGDLCPICGHLSLMREGNCMTCEKCGYTTC